MAPASCIACRPARSASSMLAPEGPAFLKKYCRFVATDIIRRNGARSIQCRARHENATIGIYLVKGAVLLLRKPSRVTKHPNSTESGPHVKAVCGSNSIKLF